MQRNAVQIQNQIPEEGINFLGLHQNLNLDLSLFYVAFKCFKAEELQHKPWLYHTSIVPHQAALSLSGPAHLHSSVKITRATADCFKLTLTFRPAHSSLAPQAPPWRSCCPIFLRHCCRYADQGRRVDRQPLLGSSRETNGLQLGPGERRYAWSLCDYLLWQPSAHGFW